MKQLPAGPSRQPYTGQLVDTDPISSRLRYIGQDNPYTEAQLKYWHGRPLAGFGSIDESPVPGVDEPQYRDQAVGEAEREDDVYGSGIFDSAARPGTVHTELGIFGDHPSLPGFVGRETQFAVHQGITDWPAGADVVTVPAGGMAYVERGGINVGPDCFKTRPCPPQKPCPAPITTLYQPYAIMPQRGMGDPVDAARARVGGVKGIPQAPGMKRVPWNVQETRMPTVSIVDATQVGTPIKSWPHSGPLAQRREPIDPSVKGFGDMPTAPTWAAVQRARGVQPWPHQTPVPGVERNIPGLGVGELPTWPFWNAWQRPRKVTGTMGRTTRQFGTRGVGQTSEPLSTGAIIAYGVIAGLAVAGVVAATRMKVGAR